MGLFTSNCKKCHEEITWFLDAPKEYHCKHCGEYNSPEEITKSWQINYDIYQKVMSYFYSATKLKVIEIFKDNPVAMVLLRKTYWPRQSCSFCGNSKTFLNKDGTCLQEDGNEGINGCKNWPG